MRKDERGKALSGRIITFILAENYDRRLHGDGGQD
jgi:hypothetical protein